MKMPEPSILITEGFNFPLVEWTRYAQNIDGKLNQT